MSVLIVTKSDDDESVRQVMDAVGEQAGLELARFEGLTQHQGVQPESAASFRSTPVSLMSSPR